MLRAEDLLVLARRTAGVSQAELALRMGRPRSTIARWELGEMQPPYNAVMDAIAACGKAAIVELANADSSYLYDIAGLAHLAPIERARRLAHPALVTSVEQLAQMGEDLVVIGDVAAVLHGWPLMLPRDAALEVCATSPAAGRLHAALAVAVLEHPPGTGGIADLRRHRERVEVPGGSLQLACPLDLLRIESARGHAVQAGALEALIEWRRRWPEGPPPAQQYSTEQAHDAIEQWLTRS